MGKHQYKGLNEEGRGIPALIVDLLETDFGRWHSIDELVGMVHLHRPEYGDDEHRVYNAVQRAVHRLIHTNAIEVRHNVDFRESQAINQYRCGWRDYWEREEIA